jgi:hypothetical protein
MLNRSRLSALAAACFALLCGEEARANYYINSVVNNSPVAVNVLSVVKSGTSITRDHLGWNGYSLALAVEVPPVDVIKIYENGTTNCPDFGASVAIIEYRGQKWGFGYQGNGAINITINADYTLTLGGSGTPGGNGKVFPGGC